MTSFDGVGHRQRAAPARRLASRPAAPAGAAARRGTADCPPSAARSNRSRPASAGRPRKPRHSSAISARVSGASGKYVPSRAMSPRAAPARRTSALLRRDTCRRPARAARAGCAPGSAAAPATTGRRVQVVQHQKKRPHPGGGLSTAVTASNKRNRACAGSGSAAAVRPRAASSGTSCATPSARRRAGRAKLVSRPIARQLAQDLDPGPVRRRAARLPAAAPVSLAAVAAGAPPELVSQAGLADSRPADQQKKRPPSRERVGERRRHIVDPGFRPTNACRVAIGR